MGYLWIMEFYSATKKNEILTFASKCTELETIILNKVSQAQKAKNHMFSLIYVLQTWNKFSKNIRHGSQTKGRMHTGGIGKEKET
jgi:hypothetical protein